MKPRHPASVFGGGETLLFRRSQFLDAAGGRQVFRHRASKFDNRTTQTSPPCVVLGEEHALQTLSASIGKLIPLIQERFARQVEAGGTMLMPKGNLHHSKLPQPGAIGRIAGPATVDPPRKCIVSHYPLCDNVLPYSRGIHMIYVRFLDNREIARLSGIWFEECR